jgi:thiol-disulfide isomerase/thioredoxin
MQRALLTLILVLLVHNAHAQETMAPAFTLANTAGEKVMLPRTHDGVDIYFFWASWCPYCKALMPHLQSMIIEHGDDLTIYALNIRDDEDPAKFMNEHGYDFVVIPEADSVMEPYGVRPTPAVFVVDGKGRIRFNLYKMIFDDSSEYKALSHGKKAGLRAPYWGAAIRQSVDKVLIEREAD